ncbi:MAG TPA: PEP-CTERM sorting domain-containing protein [Bryobacteraceae bacterium]|nr:PEP-CTERM sorting domain-containing protein [Bryobacteraceae bacterium]
MKIANFRLLICLAASVGALPASVSTAAIQYNYSLAGIDFLTGNHLDLPVQGFSPTLGTLNAIDFSFAASAVLVQGDAISSRIQIFDGGALLDTITFPTMMGRAEQTESGTFAVPITGWTDFETAGTVHLTATPFTACRGSAPTPSGCNDFTGRLSGAVTYTYAPAPSPVPEPDTILLFATGLIGVAFSIRGRDRATGPRHRARTPRHLS